MRFRNNARDKSGDKSAIVAWHNSDIGGFCCGTTTPELYIRWLEYGAFCPVMRAHGAGPAVGGQDTEPWAFGPEAEATARRYIQLRYRLLPYLYSLAHENHATGMPLARPLFFDYPEENVYNEGSSYLLGDAFLVHQELHGAQGSGGRAGVQVCMEGAREARVWIRRRTFL